MKEWLEKLWEIKEGKTLNILVCWDVTLHGWTSGSRHYHTAFIFQRSGLLGCLNLTEEGASVLWNIQNHSPKDTASYHIIYHIMSCHVISYHDISYHILSHISYIIPHLITSCLISCHVMSYHIPYRITSYHISYHILSHHIMSYLNPQQHQCENLKSCKVKGFFNIVFMVFIDIYEHCMSALYSTARITVHKGIN